MLRVFAGREGNAAALLAYALYRVYGLAQVPPMARTDRGKPWFPTALHIRFSLSHSGSLALCAVGSRELGADIETVRPRRESLPRFALTPEEYELYLRGGGTWEAFYALWTRKEAWCKYTGMGLPPRPSRMAAPSGVFLHSYAGEDWRCAVCALQPPPKLEWVEGYAALPR